MSISLQSLISDWSLLQLNKLEINGLLFHTLAQDDLKRLSRLGRRHRYLFIQKNTLYYVFNHCNIDDADISDVQKVVFQLSPVTPSDRSLCRNISDSFVLRQTKICLENFTRWYQINSHASAYSFHDVIDPIYTLRNTRFHATLLHKLYHVAYVKIVSLIIHNAVQVHHTDLEKLLRIHYVFRTGLANHVEREAFVGISKRADKPYMRPMTALEQGQLSAWYTRDVSFCIAARDLSDGPYAELMFPLVESSLNAFRYIAVDSLFFHPGLVHYLCTVDLSGDAYFKPAVLRFLNETFEAMVRSLNVDQIDTLEIIHITGLSHDRCLHYINMIKRREDQFVNYDLVYSITRLLITFYLVLDMVSQPMNTYISYLNVVEGGKADIEYGLSTGDAASDLMATGRGLVRTYMKQYTMAEFRSLIYPTRDPHTIRYLFDDIMTKWRRILFVYQPPSPDRYRPQQSSQQEKDQQRQEQHPGVTELQEELQLRRRDRRDPREQKRDANTLLLACQQYNAMGHVDLLIPYIREPYFAEVVTTYVLLPVLKNIFVLTPDLIRAHGDRLLDMIALCKLLLPTHMRLINVLSVIYNFLTVTETYDLEKLTFFNSAMGDLVSVLSETVRGHKVEFSENISNYILTSSVHNVFREINDSLAVAVNETITYFNEHLEIADTVTLMGLCTYDVNWHAGLVTVEMGNLKSTVGLKTVIDTFKRALLTYEKSTRFLGNIVANLETGAQKLISLGGFLRDSVEPCDMVTFYIRNADYAVTRIYQLKVTIDEKINAMATSHVNNLMVIKKLCNMCDVLANDAIRNTNVKMCVSVFARDMLNTAIPTFRPKQERQIEVCSQERQVALFHNLFENTHKTFDFVSFGSTFTDPNSRKDTVPFYDIFGPRYLLDDVFVVWNLFTNDDFVHVVNVFLGQVITGEDYVGGVKEEEEEEEDDDDSASRYGAGGPSRMLETIPEEEEELDEDDPDYDAASTVVTENTQVMPYTDRNYAFATHARIPNPAVVPAQMAAPVMVKREQQQQWGEQQPDYGGLMVSGAPTLHYDPHYRSRYITSNSLVKTELDSQLGWREQRQGAANEVKKEEKVEKVEGGPWPPSCLYAESGGDTKPFHSTTDSGVGGSSGLVAAAAPPPMSEYMPVQLRDIINSASTSWDDSCPYIPYLQNYSVKRQSHITTGGGDTISGQTCNTPETMFREYQPQNRSDSVASGFSGTTIILPPDYYLHHRAADGSVHTVESRPLASVSVPPHEAGQRPLTRSSIVDDYSSSINLTAYPGVSSVTANTSDPSLLYLQDNNSTVAQQQHPRQLDRSNSVITIADSVMSVPSQAPSSVLGPRAPHRPARPLSEISQTTAASSFIVRPRRGRARPLSTISSMTQLQDDEDVVLVAEAYPQRRRVADYQTVRSESPTSQEIIDLTACSQDSIIPILASSSIQVTDLTAPSPSVVGPFSATANRYTPHPPPPNIVQAPQHTRQQVLQQINTMAVVGQPPPRHENLFLQPVLQPHTQRTTVHTEVLDSPLPDYQSGDANYRSRTPFSKYESAVSDSDDNFSELDEDPLLRRIRRANRKHTRSRTNSQSGKTVDLTAPPVTTNVMQQNPDVWLRRRSPVQHFIDNTQRSISPGVGYPPISPTDMYAHAPPPTHTQRPTRSILKQSAFGPTPQQTSVQQGAFSQNVRKDVLQYVPNNQTQQQPLRAEPLLPPGSGHRGRRMRRSQHTGLTPSPDAGATGSSSDDSSSSSPDRNRQTRFQPAAYR
ncbi:small tegument protein [Elephant endotheliotropic herpesvirus 3A]|uniref:Small tegument protein n=1 Tax=Elephant endotheliotropic herpesvirus 3A TaxID=1329409 RepID=A0A866VSQ8_9BETA|nr:small tegument protein [Elephant endotheliotropic herpesvirus 3A]QOE74431.1 small tegument protein [Elephant endotheliotropic herpesvirus 3A]